MIFSKKIMAILCLCASVVLPVLFCIQPSDNIYNPDNPDYTRPSMSFDSMALADDDTIAADSLSLMLSGNLPENYFRWYIKDSSGSTKWVNWAKKGDLYYIITLAAIKSGANELHIQTAYHWNSEITDSIIKFVKVTIPVIIAQSDTILQSDVGKRYALWVNATGTDSLNYHWIKDSTEVSREKDSLFFSPLNNIDTGKYLCIVSNRWGKDTSKAIHLGAVPRYKVVYKGNGAMSGDVPVDSVFYKTGDTINVYANTGALAKTGYSFSSWNTKADSSATNSSSQSVPVMGNADITLYAIWTINQYIVKFNSMGGNTVDSQKVNYSSKVTRPLEPTKSGCQFADWYKDSLYTEAWNFSSDTVIRNCVLYAKWTINQYTVKFNSQNGSAVDSQRINYGNKLKTPDKPTKLGYQFADWYKDSINTTVWNFTTDTVIGNSMLYAKWTINQYTVKFNSRDGSAVDSQLVNHSCKVTRPAEPIMSGYHLVDWFKDSIYTSLWSFASDTVIANCMLYAKWAINQYTVKFNSQSGSAVDSQSVNYGTTAIPPSTPTKLNSHFVAWYKDSTFAQQWNFSTDKVTENTILFAKWSIIPNNRIIYDGNGNTAGTAPVDLNIYATGSSPVVLVNSGILSRIGYTFSDWNTSPDGLGTNYAAGGSITTSGEGVILYAKWIVNKYMVAYNGNGFIFGTVPAESTHDFNTTITASANTGSMTKTGHTFLNWNTKADGGGTSYAVSDTFAMKAEDLILYAQWIPNLYKLSFDSQSGSAVALLTESYGSFAIAPEHPKKTGYTFGGWFRESSCVNEWVFATEPVTGDALLYAKWIANKYKVIYNGNGFTGGTPPDTTTYDFNMPVTVLANITSNLVKTGYTFSKWNTAADGSGVSYSANSSFNIGAENIILYAIWMINKYNVTYNGNGFTGGTLPELTTHNYHTIVAVSGNTGSLVKTGCTFIGWNTSADGKGVDYAKDSTFVIEAKDVVLYAKWKIITFIKTFGRTSNDIGNSVQQTSDGGYIIAGITTSFGAGDAAVYLIKTNASGDTLWTRNFGGAGDENGEIGRSVRQTTDGGYIITGYAAGPTIFPDISLKKTDSSGIILWTKTFGGTGDDAGASVQQTSDGGYIITGFTTGSTSHEDVYLIKTNVSGITLWTKTFGGTGTDAGASVQQTSDGGYIITGNTCSSGAGSYCSDVYLIKTDVSGTILWTKTFGGTGADYGESVQQTSDGGYIVGGTTKPFETGSSDVYLVKTDANGTMTWTKTFGGSGDEYCESVQQTIDGGYIITGFTSSYGAGSTDVYLIKTDANGTVTWSKTFGGTGDERGSSVQHTSDGGYIITGSTTSTGAGGSDVYLIKTDADGNVK